MGKFIVLRVRRGVYGERIVGHYLQDTSNRNGSQWIEGGKYWKEKEIEIDDSGM